MHTTEYLCPHCGEWHKLPKPTTLKALPNILKCPHKKNPTQFNIRFNSKICTFSIQLHECLSDWSSFHTGAIKISDIKERIIAPGENTFYNPTKTTAIVVEFSTIIIAEEPLTRDVCTGCSDKPNCLLFKNIDEYDGKFFEVKIAFRFSDQKECRDFFYNFKIS